MKGGRWSVVALSRLGDVNSSEPVITVHWEYNWIDEVDID